VGGTEALEAEIKKLIVEALALEDVAPEEIDTDAALFVEGLGLDSIDALELSVALEANYGINISDTETARAAFASINALAEFVSAHRTK
jgi:acyl carrier protein